MNLAIQCIICHALAHLKKLYLAVYIIFEIFTLYKKVYFVYAAWPLGHSKGESTGV